ncbi:ABC transporter permease [Rhodovarius crocodyli]|uniref:ABC transporter permease n=1 Tax=Rhodovarius crocodyli TaxID=1979269 RepID=A0A437MIP7_9PROT|nr:ABC transporter permease [Rhodovarius crocodyli]RVT97537.1 ABC transporter permease [Rhodovarius crocodyli]
MSAPVRLFDAAAPRRRAEAMEDLAQGFLRFRLAWALARGDIMHKFRGSLLGPLWMSVTTAVMLGALGFLYAHLLRMEVAAYLPWLAVSLILWNLLAQGITDACASLTAAEGIIRQMPLPHSTQALRVVLRSGLVAAHNLPLILGVFLVFGFNPGWMALLAAPGLLLAAVNLFWLSLLLGMLCARFRDVTQIVAAVLQLAFFVTPVIWQPSMVAWMQPWLPLNPLFCLIELVREPLMGQAPGWGVLAGAATFTLLIWALGQAVFTRFRARVAFWV